ncbi:MAG: sugar ABC transporter permease [Clostridiaceae bacterium]|nr:sugar ABC transporter permease [Clostridiaceae bacterium]
MIRIVQHFEAKSVKKAQPINLLEGNTLKTAIREVVNANSNVAVPSIRKKTLWKQIVNSRTLLFMCLPAIAYFIVFCYIPMPGAYIAFTNFNYQAGIFGSQFVGFKNFEFLIQSGKLWMLTRNTILYNFAFIIFGNAIQVLVAVLLSEVSSRKFKKLSQSAMFLPYFISAVMVGLIAFNILNYDYGFLNTVMKLFGADPVKAYSTPEVWPFIILIVHLWQNTGYGSVVYFATICGIDQSIVEAAQIDGTNTLQRIRYITLPSLKSTVVILFLFALGGIMKGNFGLFYNLVGSSNSNLFPYTDIIETFVYRALMNQFNFSYSAAVGLYQSIFGFIIVIISNWLVRKFDSESSLF